MALISIMYRYKAGILNAAAAETHIFYYAFEL